MSATHGPDRIRELNSLAILAYLRSVDEATVSQIAQETGLSRTSVGATIADCEELGWVSSLPPAPSITGRPAKRYRFQSEAGVVVGLDIGANHIDVLPRVVAGRRISGGTGVGASEYGPGPPGGRTEREGRRPRASDRYFCCSDWSRRRRGAFPVRHSPARVGFGEHRR